MKKLLIFAAALAALVSCGKQEATDPKPQDDPINHFEAGQKVTLKGYTSSETKVTSVIRYDEAIGINFADFSWENTDQIKVTVDEKSANFSLKSITAGKPNEATFEGTMPATGDTYDVQYPVNDPDLYSQDYATDNLPKGKLKFSASNCTKSNGFNMEFQYFILCLNFYQNTSSTYSIGKIVVTKSTETSTPHTLSCGTGVTPSKDDKNPTPFYLILPTGEYSIKVDVYDNASTPALICSFSSGEKTFSAGGSLSLAKKEIVPAEMTLSFKKGGETITEDTYNIKSLEKYVSPTLEVVPEIADTTVAYESSNIEAATVSKTGVVTPVAAGTTDIKATVTAAGYKTTTATYTLTVTSEKLPRNLSFETPSYTKTFGDDKFTNTLNGVTEGSIAYSSDKEAVATVDENGEVTIVGKGDATITAKATNSDRYADGEASFTINVSTSSRTFSFTDSEVNKTYGDKPFTNALTGHTDGTKAYSSDKETVATVDNDGKVTIVGDGTTKISVTITGSTQYSDGSAYFILNVGTASQSFKFVRGGNEITAEETNTKASYSIPDFDNEPKTTVTYSSTDENVAKFEDSSKKDITITGKGTTTIKASAAAEKGYGAAEATYTLTVKKLVESISFDKDTLILTIRGDVKASHKLTATVLPEDADETGVSWSSSSKSVATVKNDGTVSAVETGTAYITCKTKEEGSSVEKKCTVTVVKPVTEILLSSYTADVYVNGTADLPTPTINPEDASNEDYTWTSSDETYVKIENGKIKGIKATPENSPVDVYCTAADGYGAKATLKVTVKKKAQTVTFSDNSKTYDFINDSFTKPDVTGNYHTTLSYISTNTKVATVDSDGDITFDTTNYYTGKTTITVTAPGNDEYLEASASYELSVSLTPFFLKLSSTSDITNGGTYIITNNSTSSSSSFSAFKGTVSDKTFATSKNTVSVTTENTNKTKIKDINNLSNCKVIIANSNNSIKFVNADYYFTVRYKNSGQNYTVFKANSSYSNKCANTISYSNGFTITANDYYLAYSSSSSAFNTSSSSSKVCIWKLISGQDAPEPKYVTELNLSPSSVSIGVGSTSTLTATITPTDADDKTCTWTSSEESVATVDEEGNVTGVAVGSATITCKAKGAAPGTTIQQTCSVTVTDNDVTYKKITGNPKEGTEYILVSNGYALKRTGTDVTSTSGVSVTISNDKFTIKESQAANMKWELKSSSGYYFSNGGYSFTIYCYEKSGDYQYMAALGTGTNDVIFDSNTWKHYKLNYKSKTSYLSDIVDGKIYYRGNNNSQFIYYDTSNSKWTNLKAANGTDVANTYRTFLYEKVVN